MGLGHWISKGLIRLPVLRDMARLAVQDYGHDRNLRTASTRGGTLDVGYDEPTYRAFEAGGAAEWPDPVFELNPKGHLLVRTTPPAIVAFEKLGNRKAKLDWTIQGGNPARAEQFKYMITHTPGWQAMLIWFAWARADGLRFMQIKRLDKRFNPSHWTLPDLRGGGRLKLRAGGRLHWDGVNLYNARNDQGFEIKEPELIKARDQFMVHRPGAGSSPAGDLDMGVALYNLCESWWDGFQADKIYKKRYNQEIYNSGRKRQRAPNVQASFASAKERVVQLDEEGPGGLIVMSGEDELKLRALQTNGLQDLWHSMDKTAGIIYLMALGSKITSDTSDAQGVGSSGVGLSEELAAVLALANYDAETINADLIPWYARMNDEFLEPLRDDEEECFVVPQAPKAGDQGDIDSRSNNRDKPDDLGDVRGMPQDPAGNAPGEDGRQTNPPAGPEQTAELRANLKALMATLAKPAAMVLPPVHPGCRCVIDDEGEGATGMWLDAKDARVCSECRAYGAVFNALERGDVKLTEAEADAMLDERNSREFKAALDGDQEAQQTAIVRAKELDREGIIQQIDKRRAIVPSPAELDDAIEVALDRSRATADVQRGITIGRGERAFVTPDAIVAPRVTFNTAAGVQAAVRPEFVGAVVSSGRRYSVVRTMGRAKIFDKRRNRMIATEWSLYGALLLFVALEQAAREEEDPNRS